MASTARKLQKLFVGNIPWSVGHLELRDFFREFGPVVSANVVFDRTTGCPKGYGFVVFADGDKTLKKLESKNSLFLEGQLLNVQPTNEEVLN